MGSNPTGRHHTAMRVFVSSPGDVAHERNAVVDVAEEMNRHIASKLKATLHVEGWESFPPTTTFRKQLISHLEDADLFVMIFARRYGEASTDSEVRSGTREEFEIADELRQRTGRPEIFVYFLDLPAHELHDPGPQLAQVLGFKELLARRLSYRTYSSPEAFALQFKSHLTDWLFEEWAAARERPHQKQRRESFEQWFCLGGDPPSATIIHPARKEQDADNLLPWVAAEDFHAMRKIADCLSLAGCRFVRTCTSNQFEGLREDYDTPHPVNNRVYICAFSNPPALDSLEGRSDCRFKLPAAARPNRAILWAGDNGHEITVTSPLSRYLAVQADQAPSDAFNRGRMGVDFAILARFCDVHPVADGYTYSSVYAFGLRSLGTWGAAWFLDQVVSSYVGLPNDGKPFQALLRVEYRGNGIQDVRDVSGRDQDYFDQQTSDGVIQSACSTETFVTPVSPPVLPS